MVSVTTSVLSLALLLIASTLLHVVASSTPLSSLLSPPSGPSYPPGYYTAWTFGRIWWETNTSIYPYPIGHFDNSGTAFCALSIGGGEMNLTGLGVELMINHTVENHTTNEPHVFSAYLFEFESPSQLPSDPDQLLLPPPLENASRRMNFTTANWTAGIRYDQDIFKISDPSKTYLMWLIKETEADWNRRYPANNFVTFVSFSLTRELPPVLAKTKTSGADKKKILHLHLPREQKDETVPDLFTAADPSFTSLSSKSLSSSPSRFSRRIEFLGDSLTAGYCNINRENKPAGNGSHHSNVTFTSYANESYIKTWDFLLAQNLNAAYHTIAWSGIGLVRNYAGEGTLHFPTVFERTCASASDGVFPWGFPLRNGTTTNHSDHVQFWLPQVVFINLGTNDFSNLTTNTTEFNNTAIAYVEEYKKLIFTIVQKYAIPLRNAENTRLFLFLACGPKDTFFPDDKHPPYCSLLENQISEYIDKASSGFSQFIDYEVVRFPTLPKDQTSCGHPNVEGGKELAKYAERIVRKKTGWK